MARTKKILRREREREMDMLKFVTDLTPVVIKTLLFESFNSIMQSIALSSMDVKNPLKLDKSQRKSPIFSGWGRYYLKVTRNSLQRNLLSTQREIRMCTKKRRQSNKFLTKKLSSIFLEMLLKRMWER